MAKEIKQKIVLEGEKQYNQALRDAQRNLKTLKSELKAETAELGKNATEQQKAEKKAESLRKQIAEQEKVVKTLKAALAEVKEKYGDNADEVARWEQKLNNARTTLANMKSDLEGVGSGFKTVNTDAAQATVATKSVADALGGIGSAGDSVSGAIESIFTTLIDRAMEAAEALWDMITETAGRANKFTDLGSYYGSNAQEIQMWSNSIEAAGGNFENFLAIVNRLSFGGKEKTITELLGISKENYENDIQYTLAVLDELERRRGTMGQGWYDSTMSELFGAKKSADVSWFLSNAHGHESVTGEWIYGWRDNPERFNGNESGYGMSDEGLSTMSDVYITLESIETKWNALKDKFAEGFGVATLDLLVNVEGTLDGIADYMNAETDGEREAALQKIRQNVEEFFRKLGEIIRDTIHIIKDVGLELQESDDPLTAAIGDILVKLADSLQWMVDHSEDVKTAFETIFGLWLLVKLAAVAGKLGGILMQIEAIRAFKGIGSAAEIGSAAASAGGAAGAGWGAAFGAAVLKAVPWLALIFGSYKLMEFLEGQAIRRDYGEFIQNEAVNEMLPDTPEIIRQLGYAVNGQDETGTDIDLGEDRMGYAKSIFREHGADLFDLAPDSAIWGKIGQFVDLADGLQSGEIDFVLENADEIGLFGDDFEELMRDSYNLLSRMFQGGEELPAWVTEGQTDQAEIRTDEAINRIVSAIKEDYGQIPEDWLRTTGSWNQSGTPGENGVTSKDLAGLQSLPANVESASERGVRKGISGLKVEIDGQVAGRILAPYVSQQIARDMTV